MGGAGGAVEAAPTSTVVRIGNVVTPEELTDDEAQKEVGKRVRPRLYYHRDPRIRRYPDIRRYSDIPGEAVSRYMAASRCKAVKIAWRDY